MKYDTPRDAALYLQNGLFRHKDRIVRVRGVDEDMSVNVHDVTTGDVHYIPIDELDMKPLKVGYYFSDRHNQAIYVERMPMRGWRQGLTSQNCASKERMGWQMEFMDGNFINMLLNRYPSIDKATNKAKQYRKPYPFHRRWAVDHVGKLYYKTEIVGEMLSDGEYSLFKTFGFLKETLEEALGNEAYKFSSCKEG